MYIVDGIAYAGTPQQNVKICSVCPLDNYKLRLQFNTGETKMFDFKPLLLAKAFAPLKDEELFKNVRLEYGVPIWCNGDIDIAPEKLYNDGEPDIN